jgi:uncharacterized protein HemX
MDAEIKEIIDAAKKEAITEFLASPEFAKNYRAIKEADAEFDELAQTVKSLQRSLNRVGKQVERVTKKAMPDADWTFEQD